MMECLAPPVEKRFAAMEQLARAGILPGTCMMHMLCEQYGISDRIPRSIIPGDKRTLNKRIVEALANELYYMELNGEPSRRVWAYRKAAWAIEDTPQDLGLIYRQMGHKGLESIENIGPKLAGVIEMLLRRWT